MQMGQAALASEGGCGGDVPRFPGNSRLGKDANPVRLRCPGSKSMTQRALILAALADGPCHVRGALDCGDTRRLAAILQSLGTGISWTADHLIVEPGSLSSDGTPLPCDNGGTTLRFASCLSLITNGPMVLDGNERMRQRPVGPLLDGLRQLGVSATCLGARGCPPVRLERAGSAGTEARLDMSASSQHGSGLLLVGPRLDNGLSLSWPERTVSRPYLDMTAEMMRRMGAKLSWQGSSRVRVAPSRYRSTTIDIEPDWSAAAFLVAAARLLDVPVEIPGLLDHARSLQGDSVFLEYAEELARPFARLFDLSESPDLIGPVAALAMFSERPTAIRGVEHVRTKESDRIQVLSAELSKLGARVVELDNGIDIHPLTSGPSGLVEIDPHGDHRMAMTFGLVQLRVPNVRVTDPGAVSGSFPSFWAELQKMVDHASGCS